MAWWSGAGSHEVEEKLGLGRFTVRFLAVEFALIDPLTDDWALWGVVLELAFYSVGHCRNAFSRSHLEEMSPMDGSVVGVDVGFRLVICAVATVETTVEDSEEPWSFAAVGLCEVIDASVFTARVCAGRTHF